MKSLLEFVNESDIYESNTTGFFDFISQLLPWNMVDSKDFRSAQNNAARDRKKKEAERRCEDAINQINKNNLMDERTKQGNIAAARKQQQIDTDAADKEWAFNRGSYGNSFSDSETSDGDNSYGRRNGNDGATYGNMSISSKMGTFAGKHPNAYKWGVAAIVATIATYIGCRALKPSIDDKLKNGRAKKIADQLLSDREITDYMINHPSSISGRGNSRDADPELVSMMRARLDPKDWKYINDVIAMCEDPDWDLDHKNRPNNSRYNPDIINAIN